MKLKRFASALLTFCLMLTLLPVGVSAAQGTGWTLTGDELSITNSSVGSKLAGEWSAVASTVRKVKIGSGVTDINIEVFNTFKSLVSFEVDGTNAHYSSGQDGVLYTRDQTEIVYYPIARVGENTKYAGQSGRYMVPKSVTRIQYGAFSDLETSGNSLDIYAYKDTLAAVASYTAGGKFPNTAKVKTYTYIPAARVDLNQASMSLEIGETGQLVATVVSAQAELATFQDVSWSTNGEHIATVDEKGVVTGVSAGTINIVATAADGNITAICSVTVIKKSVTGLQLSANTLTLGDEAKTLTAMVGPYDATYKTITFLSTDRKVADITVTSGKSVKQDETTGAWIVEAEEDQKNDAAFATIKVDPKGTGTASIVAITQDGGLHAVCEVIVPEVTLNKTELELGRDQTETIYATVRPGNAEYKVLEWKSTNPNVATVENGTITPKSEGSTKITVKIETGDVKTGKVEKTSNVCTVTVKPAPVKQVTLEPHELTLNLTNHRTDTLKATVFPKDISIQDVTWSSDNEEAATVDGGGIVTAVAPGFAMITVTTKDGNLTASCAVTVEPTRVTGIKLKESEDGVEEESLTLTLPLNVKTAALIAVLETGASTADVPTVNEINWLSTVPEVVSVSKKTSSSGEAVTLTANAAGSATIYAISTDGAKIASCEVTVPATKTTKLTLAPTLEMTWSEEDAGISRTLTAAVDPSNATNGKVSWYSSNDSVVKVSAVTGDTLTATLTAIGPGKTTVIARTEDGECQESCAVTVWHKPTGVEISMDKLTLAPNQTQRLYAAVQPATAKQNVEWSSSKESVAKVDKDTGVVTALTNGTATITVTVVDYNYQASCTVNVTSVTEVELNATTLKLEKAETATLKVIKPSEEAISGVKWSSSNPTAAAVGEDSGTVTAVGVGTALITATVTDKTGQVYTASCLVTVGTAISSVKLQKQGGGAADNLNLNESGENSSANLTVVIMPLGTVYDSIAWTSSNESVVKVVSPVENDPTAALITAAGVGTAMITATVTDKAEQVYTASCFVTVGKTISSIELQDEYGETVKYLPLGESGEEKTAKLTVVLDPPGAGHENILWSTSNKDVADISSGKTTSNAEITAIGVGTAMITVKVTDKAGQIYTASCFVTVGKTISSIELQDEYGETVKYLPLGESGEEKTAKLTVVLDPPGAGHENILWSTSNKDVADISSGKTTSNAEITATGVGTAMITAKVTDKAGQVYTASCFVTVSSTDVTGLSFNTLLEMNEGDTRGLVATLTPGNATDKSIVFLSTNQNVATIQADGKPGNDGTLTVPAETDTSGTSASATISVTAVKPGTATIIAATPDGKYMKQCTVTVYQPVTKVTIHKSELTLARDESFTLVATVEPATAEKKTITWESSAPSKVSVSDDGLVTALSVTDDGAPVTITATVEDGESDTCLVTVVEMDTESVSLDEHTLTFRVDDPPKKLEATVYPDAVKNQTLTWTSTNDTVATVDVDGTVTPQSPGTATILVSTEDGRHMDYCAVTVQPEPVTGIKFPESLPQPFILSKDNSNSDDTLAEAVQVEPAGATNKTVNWHSSNEKVVRVDKNGNLTAVSVGTAVIAATTEDGGFTAFCTVTVTSDEMTGLILDKTAITFDLSDGQASSEREKNLTATLVPDGATATVSWKSDNTDVAEVDPTEGLTTKVTAKKPGTAKITATATTENGTFTETCVVTVCKPATDLKLQPETILMSTSGENPKVLTAVLTPADTTEKTVKWYSSDPKVAKVSAEKSVASNGQSTVSVTAGDPGTTVIIAVTEDGGHMTSCIVTVVDDTLSIALEQKLSLYYGGGPKTLTAMVTTENDDSFDYGSLIWSSSDKSIAVIDAVNGPTATIGLGINARPGAAATITVTTADGRHSASCLVTVWKQPETPTLSKESLILAPGDSWPLIATVGDGENPEVTWKVVRIEEEEKPPVVNENGIDDGCVTVSANGVVTAHSVGKAWVRAAAVDYPDVYAECVVDVQNHVISGELNAPSITITDREGGGKTVTLRLSSWEDGDMIWYTHPDQNKFDTYKGAITFDVTQDKTIQARMVRGNHWSVTVTAYISLSGGTGSYALTDGSGNIIDNLTEATASGIVTASVTLPEETVQNAADMYLAIYNTEGALIKLQKCDVEVTGTDSQVISHFFDLDVPQGMTVGSIRLMVLSADRAPVMSAGTLSG